MFVAFLSFYAEFSACTSVPKFWHSGGWSIWSQSCLRLSQQWLWTALSSGMWCHTDRCCWFTYSLALETEPFSILDGSNSSLHSNAVSDTMLSPLHLFLISGLSDFLSPVYPFLSPHSQNPSYLPLDIQAVWPTQISLSVCWLLVCCHVNSKLCFVKSPSVKEGPLLCRYMVWELWLR
jgi:hypothetical protein